VSLSQSEYISKSESVSAVETRGRDSLLLEYVHVELRGMTASAESVVMKVEMLARDSRYLLSLIG
jgi:hypothetical protein